MIKSPQQALDAKIFAAANYTGPSLANIDEGVQFGGISEILTTVAALNGTPPPIAEIASLFVETIVDNYGHLRIEEIKIALTSSLMGKIEGAPRTFAKINLEWIGGVLAAYEIVKGDAIARTKKRLPELEDKTESRKKEDVEAEFWEIVRDVVSADIIPEQHKKILPEIFEALDAWSLENNTERITEKRRREIFELAGDIISSKDERASEYESTKSDFFTATLIKLKSKNSANVRRLRLSREIACREMINILKKGNTRL